MRIVAGSVISVFLLIFTLTSCSGFRSTPTPSPANVMETAISVAITKLVKTQTAWPIATPTLPPSLTPTFIIEPPTSLPSTPPTAISTYEAEHEEIRKVIASYFDKIYTMHNTFRVDGFGDTVSTSEEAKGFLKTELRKQALEIVWARINFLRYASYHFTLDYSEIVVYDSGQRARANFAQGHSVVDELSLPSGIASHMANVKHIMQLRKEQGKWKIIFDVHDDRSHRSLYAPTPFPNDVLNELDKQLIGLNQGQGGPVLPEAGKSFIPSDPSELNRWQEYETAFAEKLLPQYPRGRVLCEWELTEKLEQKINVWAFCITTVPSPEIGNYYFPAASIPAVIDLNTDGTVQRVEIPEYGEHYLFDVQRLFPKGAWKDIPNVLAMEKHLHWRRTHPAEPPLVVLNAAAALTGTPTLSP